MRASTLILFSFIMLSAFANVLTASGVAADLGISPDPGNEENISDIKEQSRTLQASSGPQDTLFTMYTSLTRTFSGIFDIITAGPRMLINIGIPGWIVTFVFAGSSLIVATDIFYLLTGRRP